MQATGKKNEMGSTQLTSSPLHSFFMELVRRGNDRLPSSRLLLVHQCVDSMLQPAVSNQVHYGGKHYFSCLIFLFNLTLHEEIDSCDTYPVSIFIYTKAIISNKNVFVPLLSHRWNSKPMHSDNSYKLQV